LERDEKRASAPALAHVEATVGKKIAGIVGDPAAKRLIGKLALALDAFEKGRYQDAKRIIIPITRECEGGISFTKLLVFRCIALVNGAMLPIISKRRALLCLLRR
jgi:Na+/glutamate symporter